MVKKKCLDTFFFTSLLLSLPKGQKNRTATSNCLTGASVCSTGPKADSKSDRLPNIPLVDFRADTKRANSEM